MNAYQELESIFEKLSHLDHLCAIANWDEAVMMPAGGGSARSSALATLRRLSHEILTDKNVEHLIEGAKSLQLDSWQQANLRWIEKHYLNATCLPAKLVENITKTSMQTEQAWRKLRAENNWHDFAPLLKQNLKLIKESAEIRAQKFNKNPYDVVIEDFSPGLSQQIIDPVFATLKKELPPLIETIVTAQSKESVASLTGPFDLEKQKKIGLELAKTLGFDFNHGRLDVSHHPFCGGVPEDVRMTTRYNEDEFATAFMGICHETGHARYEQGLPMEWIHQPVGRINSMALHESQSLLIEMQACRSLDFMHYLGPLIKKYFGENEAFSPENLFRIYTRLKPNLIRVDADEVTYPLHVILRYEIEKALFKDEITVEELPGVWDELMTRYLNLSTKNNFRNGVMQDVHWPAGLFGYFPAYTLGSLIAAQLYAKITSTYPEISPQLRQGDFSSLFGWLKQHIYSRALSVDLHQLLLDTTGSKLDPKFFLKHISKRYLNT